VKGPPGGVLRCCPDGTEPVRPRREVVRQRGCARDCSPPCSRHRWDRRRAGGEQILVLDHGRIAAIGSSVTAPGGARSIDLTGATVIPGLVGMHEHPFYPSGGGIATYNEQAFSFPRMYLAAGLTTARTGGSLEPYTDINVKRLIDDGSMPGPKMFITGPYLEGPGSFAAQMHELTGPDDAVRTVEYWAAEGVTSFKAYMNITRIELKAAIDAAHRHGIKVTGHLCSIGFREAAELGIDNLEHGLLVDTEFHPGKQPDVCPPQAVTRNEIAKLDLNSAPVKDMIADLVKHNVAITSTLAVFEAYDGGRPAPDQLWMDTLSPEAKSSYLGARARPRPGSYAAMLKKEQEFEVAFVKAGGLLMSGADPTGNGGAPAGFADQRNIELLVEGGFTFPEAVRIATFIQWRFVSRRTGPGGIDCRRPAGGSGGNRGQRYPQGTNRIQRRNRLRPGQAARLSRRGGRHSLTN